MINADRIVPITNVDLLYMYSLILGSSVTKLEADNIADFTVSTNAVYLANEPVATIDFTSNGTVYFVPAYNFVGFTVNGAEVTATGDDVDNDPSTLYKVVVDGSTATVEKQGL